MLHLLLSLIKLREKRLKKQRENQLNRQANSSSNDHTQDRKSKRRQQSSQIFIDLVLKSIVSFLCTVFLQFLSICSFFTYEWLADTNRKSLGQYLVDYYVKFYFKFVAANLAVLYIVHIYYFEYNKVKNIKGPIRHKSNQDNVFDSQTILRKRSLFSSKSNNNIHENEEGFLDEEKDGEKKYN